MASRSTTAVRALKGQTPTCHHGGTAKIQSCTYIRTPAKRKNVVGRLVQQYRVQRCPPEAQRRTRDRCAQARALHEKQILQLALRLCWLFRCKLRPTVIFSPLKRETYRYSQEAKQNVIELKEDDPDILEQVLRKIYDCELPAAETKTWRFWLQLMVTADKYLEPELTVLAFFALRDVAEIVEDSDEILDMIQLIKEQVGREERYYLYAEGLRKRKLGKLLKNERYRELVTSDKKLMLSLMDEVIPERDMVERHYDLCPTHKAKVFRNTGDRPSKCVWCAASRTVGEPSKKGVALIMRLE